MIFRCNWAETKKKVSRYSKQKEQFISNDDLGKKKWREIFILIRVARFFLSFVYVLGCEFHLVSARVHRTKNSKMKWRKKHFVCLHVDHKVCFNHYFANVLQMLAMWIWLWPAHVFFSSPAQMKQHMQSTSIRNTSEWMKNKININKNKIALHTNRKRWQIRHAHIQQWAAKHSKQTTSYAYLFCRYSMRNKNSTNWTCFLLNNIDLRRNFCS